jgi:aryl-alcohol dehydrogenase-like predicted oxidoreductase
MRQTIFGGYQFSQLTLGTVQLGLNYGISNESGKPGVEEGKNMLALASASGINTLDTARQYGDSEEVLGEYLRSTHGDAAPNIVTKFKISPSNLSHPKRAWEEVFKSVRASLNTFGISKLPVCLLHKGDEPIREVIAILPEIIRRLKAEGMISIGGISAYSPEDVPWFLDNEDIEATQIPLNVFDQRLMKTGLMDQLASANKLVFVRSVFLQGLFFMEPENLKGNITGAAILLRQLNQLAKQAEMSVAQLAFSFVRDLPGVNSIVFGAINEQQIRENIALLNGKPVPTEVSRQIGDMFNNVDEVILTPAKWSVSY